MIQSSGFPCLLSAHPPSSPPPPPLLPASPSGNHEPRGFQTRILRFQMFGKFLCLGHSSRVREFIWGGKPAETLPQKTNKVCLSMSSANWAPNSQRCLSSEKALRFAPPPTCPGKEQKGKNKISTRKNTLFSLVRFKYNWCQIIGPNGFCVCYWGGEASLVSRPTGDGMKGKVKFSQNC